MKHVEDFKVIIKNAIDEKLKEMGLVVKYSIKVTGYKNIVMNIKSSKIDFKENSIERYKDRIDRLVNINPNLHYDEIEELKYRISILENIDPNTDYNRNIPCHLNLSYYGIESLKCTFKDDALEVLEMIYNVVDGVIKDWHEPDERINYLDIPFRFKFSIGENKGGYIVK